MRKLWVILILFGIAGSFYNNLQFGHYHIIEGNMLIYHCHPSHNHCNSCNSDKHDDTDEHEHSNYELIVLNQIKNLIFVFFISNITLEVKYLHSIKQSIALSDFAYFHSIILFNKPFRAPPQF